MESSKRKVYVAGDFNERMGKRDSTLETTIRNVLDVYMEHIFVVTNNFYKHKGIRT